MMTYSHHMYQCSMSTQPTVIICIFFTYTQLTAIETDTHTRTHAHTHLPTLKRHKRAAQEHSIARRFFRDDPPQQHELPRIGIDHKVIIPRNPAGKQQREVCVCVCVYLYIHTYTHTHTHTHTHTYGRIHAQRFLEVVHLLFFLRCLLLAPKLLQRTPPADTRKIRIPVPTPKVCVCVCVCA